MGSESPGSPIIAAVWRSRVAVAAFAGLVAVIVVAGCGGGGGTATSSEPGSTANDQEVASTGPATLTKAQFIKRADAICEKGEKETEVEIQLNATGFGIQPGVKPTRAQQEAILLRIVLPKISKQAEEIAALPTPRGEGAEVSAIVKGIEDAVAKIEANPALATSPKNPFRAVDVLAKEFGFKVCGQN